MGFGFIEPVRNPRLTVRCDYLDMAPTEVTFGLSPSYAIHTAREAHEWFLEMMQDHEEFEVETDRAGQPPMPFWSETVRRVVVVAGDYPVCPSIGFGPYPFSPGVPASTTNRKSAN